MNANHKRLLNILFMCLTVFSLIVNLVLPAASLVSTARAQEVTAEPLPPALPEETPTEVPPPVEATADATEPPAVPTEDILPEPSATETPAAPPTQPADTFVDDFQSGSTDGWLLSPGWALVSDNGNLFLTTTEVEQSAAIANFSPADFSLSVRLRIENGKTASVAFRSGVENYAVTLDTSGSVALFRGAALAAQGTVIPAPPDGTPPLWHTLNVQIYGDLIVVTVNGTPQIVYTDPAPLPAGSIVFSAPSGGVSLDEVNISPLTTPIQPPVIPTLPAPTATPEVTAEPATPEVTPETTTEPEATAETTPESEVTPEATLEPEITPETTLEPEITPEATIEPAEYLVLSADFEGDLSGWVLGENTSVVLDGDTNHALLMQAGSNLFPANALSLSDFRLEARLNLAEVIDGTPSGLSIPFHTSDGNSYAVSIETGQTALYRNDGAGLIPLTSIPASHEPNVWYSIELKVQGGRITLTVNGAPALDYEDSAPLSGGQIAFVANAATLLDDIAIYIPAALLENVTPTPVGLTLSDEEKAKLSGAIPMVLELWLSGQEEAALELANAYYLPFDEQGNLRVMVWATEGAAGEALVPAITAVGGAADAVNAGSVEARVPLNGLVALVNAPQVQLIAPVSTAVSTGAALVASGNNNAEGFDILGVESWHRAGIKGKINNQRIKIAVLDTGFDGLSGVPAAEKICVTSSIPSGGTSHGVEIVRILCDIAPESSVVLYKAQTATELANAINNAASTTVKADVILIALDLGADTSPGDGTGGTVYTAITNARNNGRLVVVSAGNSYGRYVSFPHTGGTNTINIVATASDVIRVRWPSGAGITAAINNPPNPITIPFTATGTTGGYFTVPNVSPCDNDYEDGGTERNYCNLTLTVNGGSGYVQVQVQTSVSVPAEYEEGIPAYPDRTRIVAPFPSGANTTSSIGRPADSPNALTVGAVCAQPSLGMPIQTTSSRGPIFSSGGLAPASDTSSRTAFKPNLVGTSDVGTDLNDGTGDKVCDSDDDYGFAGTSGAAAHVAAMAALIRSNPHLNITTPDGLINYMQSHSADMFADPAVEADGFEMATGAGLAVLGNPIPDYPLSVDPATLIPPNAAFCPGGSAYFVNPNNLNANLTAGNYGSFDNPYIHVGQALAARTSATDCVILLPGEYTTPVNVISGQLPNGLRMRSYDAALNQNKPINQTATPDSVFWATVNSFGDSGGIYITADNFTLEGFVFRGAAHAYSSGVVGVDVIGANGTIIRNNIFARFAGGQPIRVDPDDTAGSQGVVIERNTFTDNSGSRGAAIGIFNTSGDTSPILIQFNTFTNNDSEQLDASISSPVIFIQDGAANIYNNRFIRNSTKGLIRVENTSDTLDDMGDNLEVVLFGNAFSDNTNRGPVIHLVPGRTFRFINNTVGGSRSISAGDFSSIIVRGDNTSSDNKDGRWEIHNNLFYDNPVMNLIKDFGQVNCSPITGVYGAETGAKNNWAWKSGNESGVCQESLSNPAFNNRVETGTSPAWFNVVGAMIVPDDPYQLVKAASDTSPDDGVDDGSNALATGPGGTFYSDQDVLRRSRLEGTTIDIGAYEYRAISAGNPEPLAAEDTTDFTFPLEAEGGFPTYTFSIATYPTLYDTDPTNRCGGQPVVLEFNSGTQETLARYCPPKNLYTDGASAESQVTFTYNVQDRAGNLADVPGEVVIHIPPTNDQPLAQAINQSVTVEVEPTFTPIEFRLRPFVSFDDNFIYSEDGGVEDVLGAGGTPLRTNTPGADYPYTYSYVPGSLTPPNAGDLNITESAIQSAIATANVSHDSLITLNAAGGAKGQFSFQYTVNESTATNTVTVEVVSVLPFKGLHDDTSFSFNYDTKWTPLYSEGSINNTLHQSKAVGAEATFRFVGTGFALYMQGATNGNFWELQVDDLTFSWEGNKTATRNNITCRTTAVTGKSAATTPNNGKYISNKQATAYTVSCNRLRAGEAHTVKIINRAAAPLNIDAIGILANNSVLLPGFHEVRETQMVPLFFGWNEITDKGTSNGIAMATTDPNVAPITFTFKGTGFAIGTALQQTKTKEGAKYRICFAPVNTGTPQVCSDEFNNATGAGTAPTWNTFRPFFGFDPNVEHEVTIDITSIPAGGRMVIDSIVIFDRKPANVLPLGTTEDSNRSDIIYGGGLEDTWVLDTNNTRASEKSLTSIVSSVTKAGPFISFQIPANANSFMWWRYAASSDSSSILVCVDRAQLDSGDGQTTFCVPKQLRTTVAPIVTNNPLVVSEADFGGMGWGTAKNGAHTVEIFSLTNQTFNVDWLQVLSSTAPLTPSSYEQTVPNLTYFDNTAGHPPTGSSMTTVNNTRASGGSVAFIKENGEGVFFRFTGTGFSTLFMLDRYAGNIQICWLKDVAQTATVDQVLAANNCRQFNNYSAAVAYQAARTIAGLEDTTYAAVIQHTDTSYVKTGSVISGRSMQVDAVVIYGDRWQDLNELVPLPNGGRYETSFANQAANQQFNYLRGVWKSVSGTSARNYSGQNYDQVKAYGAGIVFRTNGADTIRLYRDTRTNYAPLRLCYAPYSPGTFVVNYAQFECVDIRNDGGTAFQSAFNVNLGSTGPHVVSIITLNAGVFNLDAIELLSSTPALTQGIYPETDPRLIYSYGATNPDTVDINTKWRNLALTSYLDKGAMQSTAPGASLRFSFTGTGFSLLTLIDSTSSSLVASLDGTGGNDYLNIPLTGSNARTYYGHAHTISGLPMDTYTVTITEDDATRNKFTVDGVEIYGNLGATLSPGVYDDNALNANGSPVFTYGPFNAAWTTNLGTRAPSNLNRSNHTTNRVGATISFAVTGANAITLHHIASTSSNVQFCATPSGATGVRTCSANPTTLVGNHNTTFNLGASPGNYQVSITNLTPGTNLIVDAISVLNTTGNVMQPGIYQENSSLLTFVPATPTGWPTATEGSATDKRVRSTAPGVSGQTLNFTFNGTGFSIILVESKTATSSSYELRVDGNLVTLPNPANAALSTARAPFALTYVGFSPGTHTVMLTNNDATKPLLVDRVDILGSVDDIPSAVTGGIENTDARIVYFPYFSFIETAAAAASGGSQHIGSMRGSVAYFELNINAFDYVRETKSAYGQVTTCSGGFDANGSTDCTPITLTNNIAPYGYQQAQSAAATSGGWAIIRNADGRLMPLDFVRPVNTAGALTAGYYEDTLAATYSRFNFDASFNQVSLTAASGGTVQETITENAAALFEFNGTGFSVYFTLNTKADAVKICWASGLGLNLGQTQAGNCITYDNQSAATRYRAARTILGLPDGNYTASVQMLADNGSPALHVPSAQPITMQVDAIQIYDDTLPANRLDTIGTRYETSYANRNADNRFLYYGQGWRSVSGKAAARYSGSDYDTIANVIGAGLSFRTNNANSITIYRTFGSAAPALEVCALRVDNGNRTCTTVNNKTGSGVQPTAAILLNQAGHVGEHIVSIVTLEAGTLTLDAIEIGSTAAPLQPGFYEEVHPGLKFANGTVALPEVAWTSVFGTSYSGGQARWTSDDEATLEFSFQNGTGFEVGAIADLYGGEMEICYRATNNNWGDTANNRCYVYQNESSRTSYTTSRTVTGLNPAATYFVRVAHEDEKFPDDPPLRSTRYTPARLVIDYVNIYSEALPPAITTGGQYNEDAADGSGEKYLQLLPANRWNTFTGTAARGFSGGSYTGVVDKNKRISSAYAGPVATLRVTIPASTNNTTVVLYTGTAASTNTAEMLVCANAVTAQPAPDNDCVKITTLKTDNQIVLNGTNLKALGSTGAGTTVTLSFRALMPGYFRIDGFQVVFGTTLVPGIYDSFLVSNSGLLDTEGTAWMVLKSSRAFGGWLARTMTQGGTLSFDFTGTGFSMLAQTDIYGVDTRICYKQASSGTPFPPNNLPLNQNGILTAGEMVCRTITTNTTNADWINHNGDRLKPTTAYQYGFAFHGLPQDTYSVQIRHVDSIVAVGKSSLQVDAVAIFGAPDAPLAAGQIHDNTQSNIIYGPTGFWTPLTSRYGPSRGPWNNTEHNTTAVGAVAQFQIQGNTLVLYQTTSTRGSRKARICLTTPDGQVCSDFSQYARTTYFTPIAFYGLGKTSPHNFVIENWDYGKTLSIDALQVLP